MNYGNTHKESVSFYDIFFGNWTKNLIILEKLRSKTENALLTKKARLFENNVKKHLKYCEKNNWLNQSIRSYISKMYYSGWKWDKAWIIYQFSCALRQNDAKNMTLAPCYLHHFQIFDKTDSLSEKFLNFVRIKKCKWHLWITV